MPCRVLEMWSCQWASLYLVKLISSHRVLSSGCSPGGAYTLQGMALWIDTHWVSRTDLQCELPLSSRGRSRDEVITEISQVRRRKRQKMIDSVWLTIVCVLRLPTVWGPEVWRLVKAERDRNTTIWVIYSCNQWYSQYFHESLNTQ